MGKWKTASRTSKALLIFLLVSSGAGIAGTLFLKNNKFLIFPNPIVENGAYETDSVAYAQAYYEAIDPHGERATLQQFIIKNDYANAAESHHVIFGDTQDLGYGRDMRVWKNVDGTVAAYVKNFQVAAYKKNYGHLNLVAAIKNATKRYHVGTNAIEYSPGPNGGAYFAKFYNFDPKTGQRNFMVNLDGLGNKAMPGICISCHGGRADPLTPPSSKDVLGNDISSNPRPLFALVQNSYSQQRGDVQGRLQPFKVDTFDFAPEFPGYSRAAQEAQLKAINQIVLCTYPISAAKLAEGHPEDACRPVINGNRFNEWQGTAADFIKAAYGGDGLPDDSFSDSYVPADWTANSQQDLYRNAVSHACMTCHLMRGTGNMADIDFTSYEFSFKEGSWIPIDFGLPFLPEHFSYLDRIKTHVYERGNMPLAKIVSDDFWKNGTETLASYLEGQFQTQADNLRTELGASDEEIEQTYHVPAIVNLHDSKGRVVRVGGPVANPGPDRVIALNIATLLWNESLYAKTYRWTLVSKDGAAPDVSIAWLADPSTPTNHGLTSKSPTPLFNATASGSYQLQLVAINGKRTSTPETLTLVVKDDSHFSGSIDDAASYPKPADIRFSHVKYRLQNLTCTGCHVSGLVGGGGIPPIYYDDYDRDGDADVDATDDFWFYKELRGRINFTEIAASPLLQKPSGHHHNGGGPFGGLDLSVAPGISDADPAHDQLFEKVDRTTYDLFVNWIINGAPYD